LLGLKFAKSKRTYFWRGGALGQKSGPMSNAPERLWFVAEGCAQVVLRRKVLVTLGKKNSLQHGDLPSGGVWSGHNISCGKLVYAGITLLKTNSAKQSTGSLMDNPTRVGGVGERRERALLLKPEGIGHLGFIKSNASVGKSLAIS